MNVSNLTCVDPSEDYQQVFFPLLYVVALLVGFPGNVAALFFFTFRVSRRTAFSVLIRNLALADLLILSVLPFRIHYHLNGNSWAFGAAACSATGVLFFANSYLSVCFMSLICLDRYVAALHPHAYLRLSGPRRALLASAVLWVVVGVAVLVFVLLGPLETEEGGSGRRRCFEHFAKREWAGRLGPYSVLCLTFGSLLPSAIILVCYPLAARRIAQIQTRTARRAVRVINAILAITLLCFLPAHLVYLLQVLHRSGLIPPCSPAAAAIHTARRVTLALVVLNTCLDPVLYCVSSHAHWRRLTSSRLWGAVTRRRRVYVITAGGRLRSRGTPSRPGDAR